MLEVRGETLQVSIGLSPRRKVTPSNMFQAESFLKKTGVNPEAHMLCPRSSKILTNEDLGEPPPPPPPSSPPRAPTHGFGTRKIVPPVACRFGRIRELSPFSLPPAQECVWCPGKCEPQVA